MKKIQLFLCLACAALIATSCEKKDDLANEDKADITNTQSTVDNNKMQSEFDDVFRIVQEEMNANSSNLKMNSCATVTIDTTVKRVTIDFGDGCTDAYQTERKGIIYVDYTLPLGEAGASWTVSLDDYYVNGDHLEGSKSVTYEGVVDGSERWKIAVTGGKLTLEEGDVMTWESTRYRSLTDNNGTALVYLDDTYEIWGTASGVNRDGLAYTMDVAETTPLVVDILCWITTRLPKSGIISIKPEGLLVREVDYGDGTCDAKFTLTVAGQSIEIGI